MMQLSYSQQGWFPLPGVVFPIRACKFPALRARELACGGAVSGVDGLFRFTPNGLVQRGLAVLEVEPEGRVVVSPAPQSFQDLAY